MTKNTFLKVCTAFLRLDAPVLDQADYAIDAAVMVVTRDGAEGLGEFYTSPTHLPINISPQLRELADRFVQENKGPRHVVFILINNQITVDWQVGPVETISPEFVSSVRSQLQPVG